MKRLLLAGALVLGVGQMVFASTTDALKITSGGFTATIQDNGACVGNACGTISNDMNPIAGTDTIGGTINGWTINIVSGTSHSPSLTPFGLDITSLTAVCNGVICPGTNNVLHVIYSDINFSVPVPAGGFTTSYSNTQSGNGSTSESAYFDNGNGLFSEATLIGTVGPFTGTNHGTANGGPIAANPSYSLTLDQVFMAQPGATSFSVDGNITSNVPEPAGIALFGTVLALCAHRLRRRKAA